MDADARLATAVMSDHDGRLGFSGVTHAYRRGGPTVLDVTWVPRAQRTALLGPNGAGKTTMLAIAAGALRPRTGRVAIGTMAPSGSARARYLAAVGWMPQRIAPIAGLTCREQVAYVGWLKGMGKGAAWAAARDTLGRMDLADLADHHTSRISGGQLRRVGLAQTLVSGPSVVLLDEPTAGLDPANRAAFRDLVARLPDSISVLISTHQVDDLDDVFEDVAVLVAGRIVWSDSVASFMARSPADAVRPAESAYLRIVGAG
jgi:ABC-2 type transport system ATP-binding protein